jgi:hypothetical protein
MRREGRVVTASVHVYCDCCGAMAGVVAHAVHIARARAEDDGWHCRGDGTDLCPRCRHTGHDTEECRLP